MKKRSMITTCRRTLAVLALLCAAGCVTKSYIRRGDSALGSGNPEIAWEYYRRALSRDPALGADPLFAANMKRAAYESAVVRGRKLAAERNWDAAIAEFSKALDVDPSGVVATRELQKARLTASEDAYGAAQTRADAGDADGARGQLRRALEHNPAAERARRALAAMDSPTVAGNPAALDSYGRGVAAARGKDWNGALGEFERAVRADETHFPSRVERRKALDMIARVDALFRQAEGSRGRGDLQRAAEDLREALELYPGQARCADLLRRVLERMETARQLAVAAEEALAGDRPEEALDKAREALNLFAGSEDIRQLVARATEAVAMKFIRRGDALLAEKRYREAAAEFRRAGEFEDFRDDADAGLAAVEVNRANDALEADRPGEALLLLKRARRFQSSSVPDADVARIEAAILGVYPLLIRTQTRTAVSALEGVSAELGRIVADGVPESFRGADGYLAEVQVLSLDIESYTLQMASKSFAYQVAEEVANPEIPAAQLAVRHCYEEVRRRHGDFCRDRDAYERAKHHLDPEKPDDRRRLEHLRRRLRDSEEAHRHAERELDRVERHLRFLPATVTVLHPYTWPYSEGRIRKNGRLAAVYILRRPDGSKVSDDSLRKEWGDEDTYIENPNPGIGLPEDALVLPPDSLVRASLLEQMAGDLGNRLLREAVGDLVGNLNRESARLGRGDPTALEMRVAAALHMRTIDGKAADKALGLLADSLALEEGT